MLFDHAGAFIFPSLSFLRVIGRISFPIFAYQLSLGYSMTSNRKKYAERLLFFALISQIPYHLLTGEFRLNILFSLALGIFAIWAIEKKNYQYFFFIIPFSFLVSYQFYGLLMILIFYFLKNKIILFFSFFLIVAFYSLHHLNSVQMFSIFSFAFIFYPFLKIKLPQRFLYVFYPVHLFLILIIRFFINAF